LARVTALYYLRTFWFILIGPFLFGVALLIFGPNRAAQIFGLIMAIWPMTVFARALLLTRKQAKVWEKPTVMTVGEDAFLFESNVEPLNRMKLDFKSMRRVYPLLGYYILQTHKLGFVAVPVSALEPKALENLSFLPK
jgi:hypothetical protein